ncbi:uncharacterized protein LOC142159967 [Mixophyes fleayi]|uniref:uncharacterized protein LOC142159967 n=1 Tax=Mixophyes fleayi TaxID=3061075 RepID=UPI003F4DA7B4
MFHFAELDEQALLLNHHDLAPTIQVTVRMRERGLGMTLLRNTDCFLEIQSIANDGPIASSGLQIGDELIEFYNKNVLAWNLREFLRLLRTIGPGEEVQILVYRGRTDAKAFLTEVREENTELVTNYESSSVSVEEFSFFQEDTSGQASADTLGQSSASSLIRVLSVGIYTDCDVMFHRAWEDDDDEDSNHLWLQKYSVPVGRLSPKIVWQDKDISIMKKIKYVTEEKIREWTQRNTKSKPTIEVKPIIGKSLL